MTLLGLYGLLETATLPDMAGVEVFGKEMDTRINLEAQRFWFLALVCGVLAGLMRILTLEAHGPVPASGAGYAAADDDDTKGERAGEKSEKEAASDARAKKNAAAEERRKTGEKKRALVRKVVGEAVDMVLPVAVLGWVEIDPAIVGVAMFVSTVVSGYDVWKGIGVQMRAEIAKA